MGIFVNQVGYYPKLNKQAVLNFKADSFCVKDATGKVVYEGAVTHFGHDDVSGDDTYIADFTEVEKAGKYVIAAGDEVSCSFSISNEPYNELMKAILKGFYYLRCGVSLEEKYAGKFIHKACHTGDAYVYDNPEIRKIIHGGWHDAGDFGRYVTPAADAVAHLLYSYRMFRVESSVEFNIPPCRELKRELPDILAEAKVEIDWLLKMQREDGAVYHKLTSLGHADFMMPEDDKLQLVLLPVSSIATADFAAVMALGYIVYKEYDEEYANTLMDAAILSYKWLMDNPEPLLFYNPKDCSTGEYNEDEDITNRFFAAAAMYDATGEVGYFNEAKNLIPEILEYEKHINDKFQDFVPSGTLLTQFGYGSIAGLGSLSLILASEERNLDEDKQNVIDELKGAFAREADRLIKVINKSGYSCSMVSDDFIWGSNQLLLKYAMVLIVADYKHGRFINEAINQIHYLLGVNALGLSYVTGYGDKSVKNIHLRQAACDGIDETIPGYVAGGPNKYLQDEWAAASIKEGTPPMKCYADLVEAYSLNEITIYWNSPAVFVLAAIKKFVNK